MSRLPDLVQDTKLDASFVDNYTVHHCDDSDEERYTRSSRRAEYWEWKGRLAQGGCGEVWLQHCSEGKRSYEWRAIKVIATTNASGKKVDYMSELEAIAKFSQRRYSKCFVKFLGWYTSTDALFIAMEYFPLGDLQRHMSENPPMAEEDAREITYQVLEGLHFMHQEEFAHRDLKPGNILIKWKPPNATWWVKLSDFGISKRIDAGMEMLSTVKGTVSYMAPELLGYEPGSSYQVNHQAADMWSLGEMIFRMVTKAATFPSHGSLFRYMARPDLFPSKELSNYNTSQTLDSFVRWVMRPTPEGRPTSKQALDHAWIQPCRAPEPILPVPQLGKHTSSTPSLPLSRAPDPWATMSSTASGPRTTTNTSVPNMVNTRFNPTRVSSHQAEVYPRQPETPVPTNEPNIKETGSWHRPKSWSLRAATRAAEVLGFPPKPPKPTARVTQTTPDWVPVPVLKERVETRETLVTEDTITSAESTSKISMAEGKRLYSSAFSVWDLFFTPDNRQLVLAHKGPSARDKGIWAAHSAQLTVHDARRGDRARQITLGAEVYGMTFTEGLAFGKAALMNSKGGFEIWSLPDWQRLAFDAHSNVVSVCFRPKHPDQLFTASKRKVQIWKLDTSGPTSQIISLADLNLSYSVNDLQHVECSGNGRVLGALAGPEIHLWKCDDHDIWKYSGAVRPSKVQIVSFQFDKRGGRIICCDNLGAMRMFDLRKGTTLWQCAGIRTQSAAFSPDYKLVAMATISGATIVDWTGAEKGHLIANIGSPRLLRFSTDGTLIAAAGAQGVAVWALSDP